AVPETKKPGGLTWLFSQSRLLLDVGRPFVAPVSLTSFLIDVFRNPLLCFPSVGCLTLFQGFLYLANGHYFNCFIQGHLATPSMALNPRWQANIQASDPSIVYFARYPS